MFSKKRWLAASTALVGLLLALVLVACGDPTATPVPPPTPTTAPTATTAPTTAPPTTAAPTTVAATTAAAAAATTAAASVSGAGAGIPAIGGNAKEVAVDPTIANEISKQIPGLTGATIKFYVSDDTDEKLANDVDAALTAAGYKFGIPGTGKPTKQGDSIVGFYVKSGSPDILLAGGAVPADTNNLTSTLNIPGLDPASVQKLADQIKGKKSLLVLIAAPGLLQTILGGTGATTSPTTAASGAGAATTAAATTAAATSAAASSGSSDSVGESDVPVYASAKRVDSASASFAGTTSVVYVSSDDYSKITGWAKQAFTDKGWSEVNTLEAGGATVITGKKGKFTLLGTIIGPKGRDNASYDSLLKQANAGPNDTVIAIVITG